MITNNRCCSVKTTLLIGTSLVAQQPTVTYTPSEEFDKDSKKLGFHAWKLSVEIEPRSQFPFCLKLLGRTY